MSEYTPHTDDVAMAYIHGASQDYYVANRADALRAEFYRWLAEHDREVKEQAQAGLFWNDQVMILMGQAWDEGFDAGIDHAIFNDSVFNPYSDI